MFKEKKREQNQVMWPVKITWNKCSGSCSGIYRYPLILNMSHNVYHFCSIKLLGWYKQNVIPAYRIMKKYITLGTEVKMYICAVAKFRKHSVCANIFPTQCRSIFPKFINFSDRHIKCGLLLLGRPGWALSRSWVGLTQVLVTYF